MAFRPLTSVISMQFQMKIPVPVPVPGILPNELKKNEKNWEKRTEARIKGLNIHIFIIFIPLKIEEGRRGGRFHYIYPCKCVVLSC